MKNLFFLQVLRFNNGTFILSGDLRMKQGWLSTPIGVALIDPVV